MLRSVRTMCALAIISAVRASDRAPVNATGDDVQSVDVGAATPARGYSGGRLKVVDLPPQHFSKRLLDKCADVNTKLLLCKKLRPALQRDPAWENSTTWNNTSEDLAMNHSSNTTSPTETQIVQSTDEETDEGVGGTTQLPGDRSPSTPTFGGLTEGEEYVLPGDYSRGGVGGVQPCRTATGGDVENCGGSVPELEGAGAVADRLLGSVMRFISSLLVLEGDSPPTEEQHTSVYNSTQVALQGRAKIKRIFGHMGSLLLVKAVTVGAVLLGAVKLVAGKALLLSAASFLLAAVLGLKRLSGGGKSAVIVHAHKPGGGGPIATWDEYQDAWAPYHRREATDTRPYSGYYDVGAAPAASFRRR